jgi:hypothetical protein
MSFWTRERAAQAGIAIQFLALIRCLGEYFRIKTFAADRFSLPAVEPFVTGALIAAGLAAVSVGLFFWEKYRSSVWVSALTVAVLVLYKLLLM